MKVVMWLFLALLILAGFNGHSDYFRESGYGLNSDVVQYHGEPARLVRGSGMTVQDISQDRLKMWEQGYGVIGTAHFNGSTMGTDSSLALAVYFAKMKDMGLGVSTSEPTRPEQQTFGTNKGIVVRAVRNGSSAYDAEILPGDLILKFDGYRTANSKSRLASPCSRRPAISD
jgi:hypothetical protein